MEKQSFELITSIQTLTESHIISWGRTQALLPWFLLSSFARAFCILLARDIELIHLGDALLSPLGYVLGATFRIPVVATVHGLDVVFRFKAYQMSIPWFLKQLDRIICVSEETKQQVLARGIPHWKTAVIPNGITVENPQSEAKSCSLAIVKKDVENIINQNLKGKTILLTVGRLVKRKGVDYFIRELLPGILAIEKEVVYFVAGQGSHRRTIEQSIKELHFQNHVFLFGRVDEDLLQCLYSIADIFVMPNIPVEGDMEGFGIAALEANLASLTVVASRLEGLKDAITHGQNGYLIHFNHPENFISTIVSLIRDPSHRKEFGAKARQFVISHYKWHDIAERYLREFETVMKTTR